MKSEFDKFAIHGKLMKRGIQSNQNQVIWNLEISYFQNQHLLRLKFGENEEHYELICKIKLLNLIKTQIIS